MLRKPLVAAPQAFIRASVVANFYASMKAQYGALVDTAFLQANLDPRELNDPDAAVSYRLACIDVQDQLALATGDPCIGLHIGAATDVRTIGALGYVLRHSPTLGAALANQARYYTAMQGATVLEIRSSGLSTRLVYSVNEPGLGEYRQDAELTQAMTVRFVRDATGRQDWAPQAVHFAHTAPRDLAPYRQYFAAPVHFGKVVHALVIATSDLDMPLTASDPGLLHVLQDHVEERLRRSPKAPVASFVDELRQQMTSIIHSGNLGIESLAARLNIPARTLQRRLQEHGLSYVALLSTTRCELAKRFLADPQLALSEITFLIGYSEQSVFNRAFRDWTGKTPLNYRRELTLSP